MRRWLVGLAVVCLGWLASPAAVPVYDGVGVPDEPYRFVGHTPSPSPAGTTVSITSGRSDGFEVKTAEIGPQAIVNVGEGAFRTPSASSFTVMLTPVAVAGTAPTGTLDGNVYRISATNQATINPQNTQGFVFLRAATVTRPSPFMVYRHSPAEPWTRLKTTKAGTDTYAAPFRELGDFAMVRPRGSSSVSAGGLSLTRVLVLGAGVLLLLVVTVLVLRRPGTQDDE